MGRILGMALFVIACLLFTLGALALVQIVQEDRCAEVGAQRVSANDARGMGYVCVTPDGRVVNP